jgi:hypothetical protein
LSKFEEKNMAETLDSRETVGLEELVMSNVIEQEALVNLLVAKGIIKKAEILEEITRPRPKYNV